MSDTPLWITESDVVSLMDLGQAIDALETGLLAESRGDAQNMQKTHAEWPASSGAGTLHAIGAVFTKDGFAGTKTWAHTPGGATPLLILFDSNTGKLKAIIEAFALGQMRTASASGVATRRLAAENAGVFAIIGAGKQALPQAAAVLAVRPIRRIRVFSRNEERRTQFASRLQSEFGVEAVAAGSVAEATRGAHIVTVVTRATDPMVDSAMLAPGTHVNAVGAITPRRAELAQDVLSRCTRIVADSVPQARRLSRELMEFLGSNEEQWNRVESLASLVAGQRSRAAGDDLTLFKSLGMGISDLALGIRIYQDALRTGRGRAFDHPQKAAPRLSRVESKSVKSV